MRHSSVRKPPTPAARYSTAPLSSHRLYRRSTVGFDLFINCGFQQRSADHSIEERVSWLAHFAEVVRQGIGHLRAARRK